MTRHNSTRRWCWLLGAVLLAGCAEVVPAPAKKSKGPPPPVGNVGGSSDTRSPAEAAKPETPPTPPDYEAQPADERLLAPFKDRQPITFVNHSQQRAEWERLPAFWNEVAEKAADPITGQMSDRKAVKIKVPLGLTHSPVAPTENPLTVGAWALGKKLYFDPTLSASSSVSCKTCHDPARGYTDHAPFSIGVGLRRGERSAPTLFNTALDRHFGWDGAAESLEEQALAHLQNPGEMFDGDGDPWRKLIDRVRAKPEYVSEFKRVFGHEPTRDAVAKALASYQRLILTGNSIHDRADVAMRKRLEGAGGTDFTLQAADYETAIKDAFAKKDAHPLTALGLDPEKDAGKAAELGKSLKSGRDLFFGKAHCSACHAGDNFTDGQFHNVGIGAVGGRLLPGNEGRYAKLRPGHKHAELMGAFKTPTLRSLVTTAPYFHDGIEKTLEDVVNYYDRGGNANPYLDPKLRDAAAEQAYRNDAKTYKGPEVKVTTADGRPVIPLPLKLTDQEKKDLVLFLKALQGDPIDPIVADPNKSVVAPVAAR